ncbi:helix-turn-helix domain-containing protein [uncultured Duncaniella sp.]|nr:helix-turn-helix domain-containing protein [uncultured Duncaniella sp.]
MSPMNCTPKVRQKTFGVLFMKYSYEQRLVIVQRVKQGEAIAHLSKEYHINKTQILAWVRMWDKYGRVGLEKQPHCRPTPALKEKVVRLILEKGVPLALVRIEYCIGKTALQRWVSMVRKDGYESLHLKKKRGRPPKDPMARPKKKGPRTELEKLQAENLRLRAENALLKKVKALVEEQKAQARLNGQKPSTN